MKIKFAGRMGVLVGALVIVQPALAGDVKLPPLMDASSESEPAPPPNPWPMDQRIGYAVVGLGHLSLEQILPAFGESKYAKLVALVGGHADKMAEVGRQYGIPKERQYTYENFEKMKDVKDIQVVYIVLPNSMHKEYTLRAARIGKNVLAEKPMATTASDAQAMIEACKKAQVKLMIAYRMQYEPYNRAMIDLIRSKKLGEVGAIESENVQAMGDPEQWRLKKSLSGFGALGDVGIYSINAFRYLTGEEPVEVFGSAVDSKNDPRFKEVTKTYSFMLRFPSGVVANGLTSFGLHRSQRYRVLFSKGWAELDPAFAYQGLHMRVAHKDGEKEVVEEWRLPAKNQFALELDHLALCIVKNREPHTPGEEGLEDQRIIEAIAESARTHKTVKLSAMPSHVRGPDPESN